MNAGWILTLALAASGVDYGWQPGESGGADYVVQLDRLSLGALKDGTEVTSAIPRDAGDIRQLRIRVGKEELPQTYAQVAQVQYVAGGQTPTQPYNPTISQPSKS